MGSVTRSISTTKKWAFVRSGVPGDSSRGTALKVWTDGSSKDGIGQVGVAFEDGTRIATGVGKATSNEAEYLALLTAVQYASDHGILDLAVYTDSALVVNQVNGRWKESKHKHLRDICRQIQEYVPLFRTFVLQYVPREQNKEADGLSKASLGEDQTKCGEGRSKEAAGQSS